jgi:DNA-binding response OmpR family regulator
VNKQRKILLVEDDILVQKNNKEILEMSGYAVILAMDLAEARKAVAEQIPDIIVLDIGLPDGDGIDYLKELRQNLNIPILMLTAAQASEKLLESYQAGGDDYLSKPYILNEFLVRIDALMRRASIVPEKKDFGSLRLDVFSHRAFINGEDLILTQKEFALLLVFAEYVNKTLSVEFVYEKIWKSTVGNDKRSTQKKISDLRTKLENGRCDYTINSVYGEGYCFEKI